MAKKIPKSILALVERTDATIPNIEIERKFLLTPEVFSEHVRSRTDLEKENILQGWFKHDDGEQSKTYRVRKISGTTGNRYILEFKEKVSGHEFSKREYETKITESEFEKCISLCKWLVTKDRYSFTDENIGEVVVDVYLGREEIVLEKEFKNLDESKNFTPAEWFGQEVTDSFSSKWAAKELSKEIARREVGSEDKKEEITNKLYH